MKNHWPEVTYRTYLSPASQVVDPLSFKIDPQRVFLEMAKIDNRKAFLEMTKADNAEHKKAILPKPPQAKLIAMAPPTPVESPNWCLGYLSAFLCPKGLQYRIPLASQLVARVNPDVLACRGISGALVGSGISLLTGKPLIIVRKEAENRHSNLAVEGVMGPDFIHYLIVDDFICSGETAQAIIRAMHIDRPLMKCLGVIEVSKLEDKVCQITPLSCWIRNESLLWPAEPWAEEERQAAQEYLKVVA
jgi:hypothetical protein